MKVSNDKKTLAQNLGTQGLENKNTDKAGAAKAKSLDKDLKTDLFKVNKNLQDQSASVDLSNRAQEMKKAKELATNAPETRDDKLKKLQSMIDSGTYKVDSKKIADKMVDEELMNSAALGE